MNVTIKGEIKSISDKVENNGFSKQSMVITTEPLETYPQYIEVEFLKDKCALTGNLNEGDAITVETNLKGRQWINPQGEVKTFNSFSVWKITEHIAKPIF